MLPPGTTPQSLGVARAGRQRVRLTELGAAAAEHGWALEHLAPTVGTVVHGVELRRVPGDAEQCRTLRLLFAERGALFFREQQLDHAEHMSVAGLFGPLLTRHPFARLTSRRPGAGHPDGLTEIIRIVHDADDIGTENNWHTDLSAQPVPPGASMLVARQMPEIGGDTVFADMEAAFESLPRATKRRLCALRAGHILNPVTVELVKEEYSDADKAWFNKHWPGNLDGDVLLHPLVRKHPATGRPCLYISPQQIAFVAGVDEDESARLLTELNALPTVPEFQCRFSWRANSVALYDNVRLQHYGVSDYYPERRIVERVTIGGEPPVQAQFTEDDQDSETLSKL